MFPDAPQSHQPDTAPVAANKSKGIKTANQIKLSESATPYEQLVREFVGETRSQLATLTGEVALRNKVIQENDSYVYGDLLSRMLDIPIGHDFTPVNWLRRVAEIHRAQTMGDGFTVTSSYTGNDPTTTDYANLQQSIETENAKKKTYAAKRTELIEAMMRDNGGHAMWARMVENASVVGNSILKCWFDDKDKKYRMEMIEAVEHFYILWSKSNFRDFDACAFVYQISKQQAVDQYDVPPDVATSPLGMPLAVLSSANIVEYISTQPMVTVMEVTGRIQGWGTDGDGVLKRVPVGSENPVNVVIVGDRVKAIIDDLKKMPKFYNFPNKLIRRRPWGLPDITQPAININLTYIETLSDWRTLSSKLNFPKYKAFGFGLDQQIPKPKRRTIEFLPMADGQDIQPIQNPNSEGVGQKDFEVQMAELKEEFVRETGISQVLFDNPDNPQLSGQAQLQSMGTIGDQVESRRQLWTPIIVKVFEDALYTLADWDDNIKELVHGDDNWYLRVQWPSALRKDDPAYQTMLLNRLNSNTISIQTFLERHGETKEELDRLIDELNNPELSAIHGKVLGALAQLKFFPPATVPPKVNVNLRGDLNPYEVADVAAEHQITGPNAPYPDVLGPQGNVGLRANDANINKGLVNGDKSPTANYQQLQPEQQPQILTPPGQNQPGQQAMSQPGSGAPAVSSAQGAPNKQNQQQGG